MKSNFEGLITITGGTGFIGSHVVNSLLKSGARVRLLVRPKSLISKKELLDTFSNFGSLLEIKKYDLMDPASVQDALEASSYVIHMASEYQLDARNVQKELIDVAILGTQNILNACYKIKTLQKLIVTSSVAAVSDSPQKQFLDESDWNTLSTKKRNPYYFAKTKAEEALWRWKEDKNPFFRIATINPSLTIGPSLIQNLNTSNKVILDILNGGFPGIVNLAWNIVDVRDVAKVHILSMLYPETEGRFLCTHKTLKLSELVQLLQDFGYINYRLPKKSMEHVLFDKLLTLISYLDKRGRGSYLRTNIGHVPAFNNQKIRSTFGMEFVQTETTIKDTVNDLINWRHLEKVSPPIFNPSNAF